MEFRSEEIALESDPELVRDMRFFFDLDRRGHPEAIKASDPELAEAVDALYATLTVRLFDRCRGLVGRARANDKATRDACGRVSKLLLELVHRYYPSGPDGESDAERVFDGMARFADGALRTRVPDALAYEQANGEPNGPEFFLFGELALLAIELDIDADAWKRLLPAMVGPQAVYAQRYSNGPKDYRRGYRRWNRADEGLSAEELARVKRACFEAIERDDGVQVLADLMAETARRAFRIFRVD